MAHSRYKKPRISAALKGSEGLITTIGQELLQLDQQIQASLQTIAVIETLIASTEESGNQAQLQLLKAQLSQHKAAQEHLAESSKTLQAKLETAKTDFETFKQLNTALVQINGEIAGINEEISKIATYQPQRQSLEAALEQGVFKAVGSDSAQMLSLWQRLFVDIADVVYVGSRDNNLYAVDAFTGQKKWHFPTGGEVWSSPTVVNDVVYVGSGSGDKNLYAVDAGTGKKKWSFPTRGEVFSSPTVVTGKAKFNLE